MKLKITLLSTLFLLISTLLFAQDEEEEKPGLVISGSVDVYYKYDFSGYVDQSDGTSNIKTSFADNQNSISVGMLDVGLSQTFGKASFVGEFSFGPRSFKSIPTFQIDAEDDININIQNIYMTYAFSDKFSLTAGYMGTFVGYEVISPAANFNYSTSYLFSFGPFQNAGFKLDWTIADNFSIMAGVFNDWNVYQDFNGVSDIGAQIYWAPIDGWDIYLNFLTGSPSGTIIDLTTGWQITNAFYLGLNAADYTAVDSNGGYSGFALYPQFSFTDLFALGLRTEYFATKDYTEESISYSGSNVIANTLTGNFYLGPLTFITELRLDDASDDFFFDSSNNPTSSASQFLFAAVYAF